MSNKIRIDIVSDVVCPWCIIGYKRLEKAIKDLGAEDKIDIHWHPFELNPDMNKEGEDIIEHLSKKYSMSVVQAEAAQKNMINMGNELDFPFNYYESMKMVNTRDAHIIIEYANEFGKQNQMEMALFKAHFSDEKNVSDRDVLLNEVKTLGLDLDEAKKRLDDEASKDQIIKKEKSWIDKGINSVPTMIFNEKSMMNGAYAIDTYKEVIKELLEEKNKI